MKNCKGFNIPCVWFNFGYKVGTAHLDYCTIWCWASQVSKLSEVFFLWPYSQCVFRIIWSSLASGWPTLEFFVWICTVSCDFKSWRQVQFNIKLFEHVRFLCTGAISSGLILFIYLISCLIGRWTSFAVECSSSRNIITLITNWGCNIFLFIDSEFFLQYCIQLI